ncbi:MAG TPA: response regulator [Thermoanaerobaculia bacterium]|jgi:CheY-like chemotaxis protein|nr:response regulator [Thermoanaerobaculia bacterium]
MTEQPRKTILLVEDDVAMRTGLEGLLNSEGYTVVSTSNGREALEVLAAADEPPSLILLDLMMPVMDGWRFLAERRRAAGALSRPPVVLLSGLDFISGATGVSDFLRKPVDATALLECVRRFLD